MPIDPEQLVNYNGQEMKLKNVPDREARFVWGLGHDGVHFSRLKPEARIPPSSMEPPLEKWPYEIEWCPFNAPEDNFVWIQNGQILVCPGCGLDGT